MKFKPNVHVENKQNKQRLTISTNLMSEQQITKFKELKRQTRLSSSVLLRQMVEFAIENLDKTK